MSLSAGVRVGVYEVQRPLGAGGMGEVYLARDTRLNRDVAIKILPDAFAQQLDRIKRFDREAQLLASLNHPHIAQIYGVEESNGARALVMELVPGKTLAELIPVHGLPIAEALDIARQICDGLEAAHEKGIIHRDLKPRNVMVTPEGQVKLLDFGLGKSIDPESPGDATNSPTMTGAATQAGMLVGTAAYMAPEQAKGRPTDRRSDVWAFGCVLFEMLTARQAFKGDDVADTLAAVLRDDPDWQALPGDTPAPIRRLLRRALIKNWQERLADLSAIRLEIDDALKGGGVDEGVPTAIWGRERGFVPRSKGTTKWLAGAAVTAAVGLAAIGGYRLRPAAAERLGSFSILPPDGTTFASTEQGGAPALSPDGRQIAFVAESASGRSLWVRSIDSFDARPLPGTEGAFAPFWSPDGGWLGFGAGVTVKKISPAGGPPQVLAEAQGVSSQGALAGAWNRDGQILFYRNNRLYSVPASGGDAVPVTERNIALFDENHYAPYFLTDGRHYLVLVRGGPELQLHVDVGVLGSNERRPLLSSVTNAQYTPPRGKGLGHVLYVRSRRLMAQAFDEHQLKLAGPEMLVAEGVGVSGGGGLGDFSVSPSGVLAYRRGELGRQEMAWFDRSGKPGGAIGERPGHPRANVRLSPDGKWVAFTRQGETQQDVWVADLAGGDSSRFTLSGGRSPVWSPDGGSIAYLRQDTIYRKPFRGGGAEVALWTGPGVMSVNDWSGDGRYLLFTRWNPKAGLEGRGIGLLPQPLDDVAKHEPVFLEGSGLHGQFVPAAGTPRWISYDGTDGTTAQVFVRTMPGTPPGKWQVSTDGGNGSRWRRDGREVYFSSPGYGSLMAVEVQSDPSFHIVATRPLFQMPRSIAIAIGQYSLGYDVTADGQRFLTTVQNPDAPAAAINVVLNWQAALGK